MKKFFIFSILVLSPLLSMLFPQHAQAASVEPFAPFSVEGNPPEDYHFEIFKLFRYFRPRALEIYENMERSRTYVDLKMCGGEGSDRRDDYCNNQGDGCDGGDVDLCYAPPRSGFAETTTSKNGSCKLERHISSGSNPEDTLIEGHCEYTKRPTITTKVRGTDFTVRDKSSLSDLKASYSDLTVPKVQCESCKYAQLGTPENPITSGSQYLNTDLCESDIRRVVVLRRAKQTKNTLHETGEWPLGWVDWGYTIPTGKTLLEMNDTLPNDIANNLNALIEGLDDFYVTGGDLDIASDISSEKKAICAAMKKYRSQSNPPEWLKDFDVVPLYPPSFRQGFVRPSICVWELCCPTNRCPLLESELLGTKRGLYYDTSISQAYNAALDELFARYPLEQSLRIFTVLLSNNPLIRYLSSAAPQATPTEITRELNTQLKGTCLDYIPWGNWISFGQHIDYLDSGSFLGPNKTCPDYELMPEVDKEKAGAHAPSLIEAIINLIWAPREPVDDVEPDKYHLLTIPDAMGQSIGEIQQYAYDTRDTLTELESVKEYNDNLSNIVLDKADNLYGGKNMGPADAKRRLGIYTCKDKMFSSQLETSIESYALGARIGCGGESTVITQCDPAKFKGIIADSQWQLPTSQAQDIIKNSAMFVGGKLNPELEEVYSEISKEYDVPCEILAGHHFEEASQFFTEGGDPTKHSVANGRPLNEIGQTLLESADLAAQEITSRPYYAQNTAGLIKAMSNFNGGGNANCQLGLPTPIPYAGCPRLFEGEDDPYVTHMLDSKHQNMYQIFCADFTMCNPLVPYDKNRPGAFAAALVVHEYLLSQSP